MSAGVVDVCLIPEVGFELQGEKGLFAYIAHVLEHRGHAVICLAEGAGQVRSPGCARQRPWAPMSPVERPQQGTAFESPGARHEAGVPGPRVAPRSRLLLVCGGAAASRASVARAERLGSPRWRTQCVPHSLVPASRPPCVACPSVSKVHDPWPCRQSTG